MISAARSCCKGQVGDAFRSMIEGQRTLVRQITQAAMTLGGTATQIHVAMRERDASTTKQAAAVTRSAPPSARF